MVDLFVVCLKQPDNLVIHFQKPTCFTIPFCGALHYMSSRIMSRYLIVIHLRCSTGQSPPSSLLFPLPSSLVGDLSRLLNRTEFSLFRYGNPPSNPLLTIRMAELSDNSTLFKGAWAKWHKNGFSAIKLIHQTWKALKRDMGDHVEVFWWEDTSEGKWWDGMCL